MSNPFSPLGTNSGYIATAANNEDLMTGFSRAIGKFPTPQFLPIKPVDRQKGYYAVFNPEPNFRLGANPLAQASWADGSTRKNGVTNQTEMRFVPYETVRTNRSTVITRLQAQQSDWPVEAEGSVKLAQIQMTLRDYQAYNCLVNATWGTNTGNVCYGSSGSIVQSQFSAATAGTWATGTALQPNIKASLLYALRVINQATGGGVTCDELCLVVSPTVASQMALSPEITQVLIQSQYAAQYLTGDDREADAVIAKWNMKYGLPAYLYGFPIVVDDTVADLTSNAGSNGTGAGAYLWGSNSAYMLRRPKNHLKNVELKQDVQEGDGREAFFPVVSSLVMITKEEFTAEAFEDPEDRITRAHIASDYQIQLTSALSAFQFLHLFS